MMTIKNSSGNSISLSKEHKDKIKSFIKRGCNSCVDEYLISIGHIPSSGKENDLAKMMFGGSVGNENIEVEGGEVADIPGQGAVKFAGPNHEQGGIKTSLPEGTDIYSKRIKVDGETMAKRKEKRDKLEEEIFKKLEKNKSDAPLRNTANRVTSVNREKDTLDKNIQTKISEEDEMMQMLTMMNEGEIPIEEGMPTAAYGLDGGIKPLNKDMAGLVNPWQESFNGFDTSAIMEMLAPSNVFPGQDPTSVSQFETKPYPTSADDLYGGGFNTTLKQPTGGQLGSGQNPWGDNFPLKDNPVPQTDIKSFSEDSSDTGQNNSGEASGEGLAALMNIFNGAGSPTSGDLLKIMGNLKQGRDLERLAYENRAGDNNINHFQDFAKDSLNTIDQTKDYLNQNRDRMLRRAEANRSALTSRNRNSARGVNTMRAGDIASHNAANQQIDGIDSQFANQMMQILGQQSQMEATRDQVVMGGEDTKAERDTQDRDNFFSALSQASVTGNEALSQTGKDMNEMKARGVNQEMLSSMSQYYDFDAKTGKITLKDPEGLKKEIESFMKNKNKK